MRKRDFLQDVTLSRHSALPDSHGIKQTAGAKSEGTSLTRMIEAMPRRALGGRGASAVLGGVIGGIVGLDTGILELGRVLRLHAAGILGFLPFLAPAARPATLESREEGVCALRHRRSVITMPMMMHDAAGLARSTTAPRWRTVGDLAVAELRGAFRELTTPVQIQSGSLLDARVIWGMRANASRSSYSC